MICPRCLSDVPEQDLVWMCHPACERWTTPGTATTDPVLPPQEDNEPALVMSPREQWRRCACDHIVTLHGVSGCGRPWLHETKRSTDSVRHIVVLSADCEDPVTPARGQRAAGTVRLGLAAALSAGLSAQRGSHTALLNPAAWALTHVRAVQVGGLRLSPSAAPASLEERQDGRHGTIWLFHAWPLQAYPEQCARLTRDGHDIDDRLQNADAIILAVSLVAQTDTDVAKKVCSRIDELGSKIGWDRLWICFRDADVLGRRYLGDDVVQAAAERQKQRETSDLLAHLAVQAMTVRAHENRRHEMPNAAVLWPVPRTPGTDYWPFRNDWHWLQAGLDTWLRAELRAAAPGARAVNGAGL